VTKADFNEGGTSDLSRILEIYDDVILSVKQLYCGFIWNYSLKYTILDVL